VAGRAHKRRLRCPASWRLLIGSTKRHRRRPHGRCCALYGEQGKGHDSLTLGEIAEKGLQGPLLSLSEQVELERLAEERQEKETCADIKKESVSLSALNGKRVLSLSEQVELERLAEEKTAQQREGAPITLAEVASQGFGNQVLSLEQQLELERVAEEGKNQGGVGKQDEKGVVHLSEFGSQGFGGRVLSLNEQVEQEERLAEKGRRGGQGSAPSGVGEVGRKEADVHLATEEEVQPSVDTQAELELALGEQLQQALLEQGPSQSGIYSSNKIQSEASVLSAEANEKSGLFGRETEGADEATSGPQAAPLKVSLLRVASPEEEHALATLRAQVFYEYPDVGAMSAAQRVTARSEFRKMLNANIQEEKALVRRVFYVLVRSTFVPTLDPLRRSLQIKRGGMRMKQTVFVLETLNGWRQRDPSILYRHTHRRD
jgi:hypothetical protein